MATATADGTHEIPSIGLPADTTSRSIRIPAPITVKDTSCSDSRFPFDASPDLSLPPPNPHFVFPLRQGPASAPASYSRASGRRTRSAFEPADRLPEILKQVSDRSQSNSPALPDFSFSPGAPAASDHGVRQPRSPAPTFALPEFSFNPGASADGERSLLRPPSPQQSPRTVSGRHGHRRGTSEFVGGKIKAGESITVMSTSPTRPGSGPASPHLKPTDTFDTFSRRRGHQHRRSAAISQHDLTMILKPNSIQSRGSSAPTSPAALKPNASPSLGPTPVDSPLMDGASKRDPALPIPPLQPPSPPPELETQRQVAQPEPSTPARTPARARVGFSDTLEFIPRPSSLVSTDTASTLRTIRPGHSASNSISSVISLGSAVVSDRESANTLASTGSPAKSGLRPSTAGAVLEHTTSLDIPASGTLSPRRRNSIPLLAALAHEDAVEQPMSTPTKTPKRWSFFGLDPFTGSHAPGKGRPQSSSSNRSGLDEQVANAAVEADSMQQSRALDDNKEEKKSSDKKRKQKKVRSWGTSILMRKSRSRSSGKTETARRRSLSPPPPKIMFGDEADEEESELENLTPFAPMAAENFQTPVHKITRPRSSSSDDTSYQMIDLDAALRPFNAPSHNPEWEAAQRNGTPSRRALHSAAGMRGFSGPGMHYHRRAESAPALPPFEGKFGMNRFGSSSTMADVFEEDEEEDEEISDASSSNRSITASSEAKGRADDSSVSENDSADTPTQERDLGIPMTIGSASAPNSIKRKGSGSSLELQPPGPRARAEAGGGSLHEFVIFEEESVASLRPGSESSNVSAPSPRRIMTPRDPASVDGTIVTLPPPSLISASPYSMSQSSSLPSPMSDAHRISTAPSSIADENSFQSLLMGEPGPEIVRISVDVPSLTSSNSTMTRDSMFLPPVRPRGRPFHDQRPASFSSTAFGRRRSSLASLSRLISSAHGERSKLSVEVAVEDEEPEGRRRVSTARRISRMMQFWKSKQSAES